MKKWLLALGIMSLAFHATAVEPELIGKDFYRWYLTALSQDESPIDERDPQLGNYVTPGLLKKIYILIKSPDGMEDDYFLQDQDYSDNWINNISVGHFTVNGETASGSVILGNGFDDAQRLFITLRRHGQSWLIDDVAKESP